MQPNIDQIEERRHISLQSFAAVLRKTYVKGTVALRKPDDGTAAWFDIHIPAPVASMPSKDMRLGLRFTTLDEITASGAYSEHDAKAYFLEHNVINRLNESEELLL